MNVRSSRAKEVRVRSKRTDHGKIAKYFDYLTIHKVISLVKTIEITEFTKKINDISISENMYRLRYKKPNRVVSDCIRICSFPAMSTRKLQQRLLFCNVIGIKKLYTFLEK